MNRLSCSWHRRPRTHLQASLVKGSIALMQLLVSQFTLSGKQCVPKQIQSTVNAVEQAGCLGGCNAPSLSFVLSSSVKLSLRPQPHSLTTVYPFNHIHPCIYALRILAESCHRVMPETRSAVSRHAKLTSSSMQKASATAPERRASNGTEVSNTTTTEELVPTPNMAPILSLPLELRKSIVEYISRNSDKRNICLTCKELRDLIMPYIYRHMVLGMHGLYHSSHHQNPLFDPMHSGLRHVRTLRIVPFTYFSSARHPPGVCQLLHMLPKNGLQSFEYVFNWAPGVP